MPWYFTRSWERLVQALSPVIIMLYIYIFILHIYKYYYFIIICYTKTPVLILVDDDDGRVNRTVVVTVDVFVTNLVSVASLLSSLAPFFFSNVQYFIRCAQANARFR